MAVGTKGAARAPDATAPASSSAKTRFPLLFCCATWFRTWGGKKTAKSLKKKGGVGS
jgi:hypothetical protein